MIERLRRLTVLLCLLIVTVSGRAQSAASNSSSSSGAGATIRVTSRIVYVDVIVRDRDGRVVRGLTQKDFTVDEDGKPQTIAYLDEHTYDMAAAEKMPRTKTGVVQEEFSNAPAKGAIAGSINIILFDLFDTPISDQLYARQQLLKFIEMMPQGQQVALFVLSDGLHMVQDFTGSSDRLMEAARKISPRDFGIVQSETEAMQANDLAANLASAAGYNVSGHALGGGGVSNSGLISASNAWAAFAVLAGATNGYPVRKNLFWLSDNFPIALGSQLDSTRYSGITTLPGARETANLVADSQIAVFPICLQGLQPGGIPSAVSGNGESSLLTGAGPTLGRQFNQREAKRAWVNNLASETGGEAFWGTNDFAGAIRRGMEDASNYYTLAYRPQNSTWNKKFRNIRVKLLRSGYSLAYQRGYFAYPDELSAATTNVQELDAALQPESPESTLLLLHSKIDVPDAQHGAVVVHSILDANNLGLVATADGHWQGRLLVRLIAFNDVPGAAEDQPEAPIQSSGVLNLDFDAAQYQSILKDGIAFTQELTLPVGRYRLRLGVSDATNHRIGTLDMPIAVGLPKKS